VLLDLNLPKKDGREVLAAMKSDESLKDHPVVILTTSQAEEDVIRAYNLNANCYVTKPVDFEQFTRHRAGDRAVLADDRHPAAPSRVLKAAHAWTSPSASC
jgi:DNA-binding response OmpR family regulator